MRYSMRKRIENAGRPRGFWGRRTLRAMNKSHDALTDWGLCFLTVNGEDDILDIGCGGGRTVKKLSHATSHLVWGIDYAPTAVKTAWRTNRKAIQSGQVMIAEASVSALPFADGSFDVVTAVETFYFWPDPLNDLREIYRVMRSGGRLMLLTEARADMAQPEKWAEIIHLTDLRLPSADTLAEALHAAGFRRVVAHVKDDALCVIAEKQG